MTTVLTRGIARLLLPATMMVAFAVLVKGYTAAGDGFSAGIIASLGVLVQYVVFGRTIPARLFLVRQANNLARFGLLIGLACSFIPVLFGKPVLTHWPAAGEHVTHFGSLELITPVAFDIGVFLLVLGFAIGTIDLVAQSLERSRA